MSLVPATNRTYSGGNLTEKGIQQRLDRRLFTNLFLCSHDAALPCRSGTRIFGPKLNIVRFTATIKFSQRLRTHLLSLIYAWVLTGCSFHINFRFIQLVDPFSVLAREQMPIGIHRHLDAAMPGLLLNVLGMSPPA